jgi:hypothetical protein
MLSAKARREAYRAEVVQCDPAGLQLVEIPDGTKREIPYLATFVPERLSCISLFDVR